MTIKEYQEQVKRTDANLGSLRDNLIHMSMGMVTETAELVDVLKKNLAYGKEIDYVNLKEEIGDSCWYIANFCNHMGWDLEEIFEININKLKKRFPDRFNQKDALNRNLEAERQVLEGRIDDIDVD